MRSPRRLTIVSIATLLAAGLVVSLLDPRWLIEMLARRSPQVVYFVETDRPTVALTIDDAPHATTTSRILDVLKRHDAHATFFVIASRVAGNEALLRRMVDEGHELGNHLMWDEPSISLPPGEFERQLLVSHDILSAYGVVRWFRPGSGWFDDAMLETLRRHGYSCALGSVYPLDTAIPSSWFAARYIQSNVESGSIIILHDGGSRGLRTAATLEAILPQLEASGFEAVTLSTLAGVGPWSGQAAGGHPTDSRPSSKLPGTTTRTPFK